MPKDPGPYSALFDYEKEKEWEQQQAMQRQAAQQKILRTNAIGDALGLLINSIGGSAGATINKQPVNPFLMRASDRFNALGDQSAGKMDQLRLTDLAQKEKDLGYQIGEERIARANTREDQRFAETKKFQQEQATAAQQFQIEKDKQDFEQQKEMAAIEAANQTAVERIRNINQRGLEQLRTNENVRQDKEIQENRLKSAVQRGDRSKPALKTDIPFQVPGTTQVIYLGEEEVAEMAHTLIADIEASGDIITDPTLRAIKRNEQVKPTSMIEVIKKNWAQVKYALPEYASDKPAGPQQMQLTQSQESELNNIIASKKLNDRQKKVAVYKYLLKANIDEQTAKAMSDQAFPTVK